MWPYTLDLWPSEVGAAVVVHGRPYCDAETRLMFVKIGCDCISSARNMHAYYYCMYSHAVPGIEAYAAGSRVWLVECVLAWSHTGFDWLNVCRGGISLFFVWWWLLLFSNSRAFTKNALWYYTVYYYYCIVTHYYYSQLSVATAMYSRYQYDSVVSNAPTIIVSWRSLLWTSPRSTFSAESRKAPCVRN